MQLDMHYYATFALARAAGMKPAIAAIVATAAQYVDDSDTADFALRDGSYLYCPATGHHPVDQKNVENLDQRLVWIPFHFQPGGEGNSLAERLVCRKDSALARQMLEHVLSAAGEEFGVALVGIAAHAYADTFSHYGFSGVSAINNQVAIESIDLTAVQDPQILSYIKGKAERFFGAIGDAIGNAVALGHGSVATYPDRPYLTWRFRYKDGRDSGVRNNQATFMEACEKLHTFFASVVDRYPSFGDPAARVPFSSIRATVAGILALEGELNDRIEAWRSAMSSGAILPQGESIPDYDTTRFGRELALCADLPAADVRALEIYRFLQAAGHYRDVMLKQLLPGVGIEVFLLKAA